MGEEERLEEEEEERLEEEPSHHPWRSLPEPSSSAQPSAQSSF